MAIGTTLPPRAYTREILTAAFNWLQTQPEAVRANATTPDALVGLYTRAQRFGSTAESDAPVSSVNFMSDLKNLAEGLKAFDGSKVQFSATEQQVSTSPLPPPTFGSVTKPVATAAPAPATATAPAQTHTQAHAAPSATTSATSTTSVAPPAAPAAAFAAASVSVTAGLNQKALSMLQEVQRELNLTTESEAANMMIALAYKTLKASLLT